MSSASNPYGNALPLPAPRPEIVKPVPPKPRPRGLMWGAAALAILAAAGVYVERSRVAPKENSGGPRAAIVRTAVVAVGDVHRTMRVGGSISAERFAAITAPRLQGNRGSMQGNRMSSRGAAAGPVTSTTGTTSSSSGSSVTITSSNTATNVGNTTELRTSGANRFGSTGATSGGGSTA